MFSKFNSSVQLLRSISSLLVLLIILNLFSNIPSVTAATYNFVQTSWSGGKTTNSASHQTNQSNWNQFAASTTGIMEVNAGADLQLNTIAISSIQTSDADFGTGVHSATITNGTGLTSSIKLQTQLDNGNGVNGSLVVNTAGTIVNTYTTLGADVSAAATIVTVANGAGFVNGSKIMLVQMAHATNAGKYELATVTSGGGTTNLTLSSGLANSYFIATGGTQVILVPQYTDVTVNSGGSIVPSAYGGNGASGGVIAFLASGTVTVNSGGSIDASAKGFAAATASPGIGGNGYNNGTNGQNNGVGFGGGGGGGGYFGGGGGGAQYNTAPKIGGNGGAGFSTAGGSGGTGSVIAGQPGGGSGGGLGGAGANAGYASAGGGGAGFADNTGLYFGGSGAYGANGVAGAGGGIIFIKTNSMSIAGTVKSDGGVGTGDWQSSNGGAGAVYISGSSINIGTNLVSVSGGGDGGSGSNVNGNIYLVGTVVGSSAPTYTNVSLPYVATGVFTSGVMDTGSHQLFTTFDYATTIPANTLITMDARSGNSATPDGTWTAWQVGIANNGSLVNLGSNRYVQYRANLSNTSTSVTPSLDSINVNYLGYISPTNYSITSDFTTESDYTQQDAVNGTDFIGGVVSLHDSGTPDDAQTVFLLHAGGTNGSTVFTDSSSAPKAITTVGNAQVSTAQSKFGGSGYLGDGTGDYLSTPAHADFVFGTGDFTIDGWIYLNSWTQGPSIFSNRDGGWSATEFVFKVETNGRLWVDTGLANIVSGATVLATGVWTHVALIRSGSTLRLFLNGVQDGEAATSVNLTKQSLVKVGGGDPDTGRSLNGYMDELRISKGVARWTANFTPPAAAYGVPTYPTTQPYYITTAAASQINTSTWSDINSITTTQTTPASTDIKYLVSFDNRLTWKAWNGAAWIASSLANLQIDGMSKTSLEAITSSQWKSSGGFVPNATLTLDFAASLKTTDGTVTPSLDSVSVNYALTENLTSSPYNTTDAANLFSKIQWTENLPAGTDVKFQLRTAPDSAGSPGTWTAWLGPDGTSATYFTDPAGGEAMPSAFVGGGNDQWFQYKVFMTSTGASTPTLSDVTLVYAVNAAPSVQTVTASQGSDGKVAISYEVKDTDTNSGTTNPGFITPSFEYWNGSAWTAITSNLAAGSTSNKSVNQSTFTSYNTTWIASSTINGQYYSAAKIRVTANDNEAANNSAQSESATFILDTTIPSSTLILVKATTTPASLTLSASDNSSLQMKVGLNSDLSDASWEAYSTTKTVTLATDPDTVYASFKDAYGNESATISASTQTTPINIMIQDTSNMNVDPDELRLFLAWSVAPTPPLGFGSYQVYRSTTGANWTLLSSIGNINTNYYQDNTPILDNTYHYKVATIDAAGNTSFMSATSTGAANGTQGAGEGGGGAVPAPSISAVSSSNTTTQSSVVSWTTDTLSNSAVGYCVSPCSDYTTNQTAVSSYVTSHSVVLGGLSPNTTYNYKVFSTNASSVTASSSGFMLTTNNGPRISSVAVTKVSNIVAEIAWNTNVAASGYVIYSTTTPPSGGEAGWASLSTARTVTLASLTGGTKYYFYVKSQDSDSNWAYDYNVVNGAVSYYTFTTPLDVTAPTISNIASTTGRTTANITWLTNEEATSKVVYGLTTAYDQTTAIDSTLTTVHSVSLSNLLPQSLYYYKVVSADGSNNYATSSGSALLTETLSLTNVSATTPTATMATITWTSSDNSNSQAEYSTFSDLSASVVYPISPTDSALNHSIELNSLSSGTTYYYRVKSSTNGVGTTTSQIYQFTTGDTTAPTVSSVSAISIKDTSAIVIWTTDEPSTSKVQYDTTAGTYTSSTTLDSVLTRNHSINLSGLSYQTKYYYRVLSTDGNSNATTSSENSFTTLEQQIGISKQTVTTTNIVSGGGSGSGSTGVPLEEVNNLKLELGAVKKERNDFKKENDELKGKIIGVNLTGDIFSPTEVISLVIDKFAEITESLTESALLVENQDIKQTIEQKAKAEKLEQDIIPAITSLRQLAKLVPPPKLKTEPKIEIGPSEAIISWLTDKIATSVVYFSENNDYSEKTPDTYTNSVEDSKNYVTDHKITLKGLSPLTDYHYRLMSESEAGARAYSSDFIFTTKPETPIVSSARAEKFSDTSILVTWKTNIPTNSAVIYTPIVAGKPDVKKSKSEGKPDFDKEHSITIFMLEPSTTYNLEISSADHFGNVALKKLEPMSIAKDQTPPVISQIRSESSVLSNSSNKVRSIFYWETDEPSTTKVIFNKGPIVPGSEEMIEEEFSDESASNEDLTMKHIAVVASWEPGQLYRFKVVSVDAFGNKSVSKIFTVMTPRPKATVVDMIIDNFSDTFNWTKKIGF